ncbi:hypothetical protein O3M35_000447 [Rhynocoris fuscipes]|uniref:Ubiquitin-like protease family profile domain-containing protein n=1 Tax=Rhynocoris fuscipes TaxID=488301 RepID=A0AAW1DNF2_9HEMI
MHPSTPLENLLILTYHGCSLLLPDLLLLEGPFWLNDKLLGFYMDYLENEVYSNLSVCFIRPEVTQCLKLYPDLNEFLDPLGFNSKDYAVMILNDCDDTKSAGGTHWSLLVFSKPEHTFYHIDSLHGHNAYCAKTLATKIALYVGDNYVYRFHDTVTLKQRNGYDCGVFVLCNLDNVLSHIALDCKLSLMEQITIEQVSKKRMELKNLIFDIMYDECGKDLEENENDKDLEENREGSLEINQNIESEKFMNNLGDDINKIMNNIYLDENRINFLSKEPIVEEENIKKCNNNTNTYSRKRSLILSEKESSSFEDDRTLMVIHESTDEKQNSNENACDSCNVNEGKMRKIDNAVKQRAKKKIIRESELRRSLRIQERMKQRALV